MVDDGKSASLGVAVNPFDEVEINVVDRGAVLVSIDEIDRRATNTLDRRQSQFHGACRNFNGLGTLFERAVVGVVCIVDTESHAAGTGAVLTGEVPGTALRLVVDDEVDVSLAPQRDLLGAVLRDLAEAEQGERLFKDAAIRRGKLDEFESVQSHRVFE